MNTWLYLVTEKDFEEDRWNMTNDVPLTFSASVAGGLILATKEREMWYEDIDKIDVSLWMVRFYAHGGKTPFFWFSGRDGKIGNLEIQYINQKLIKRIGEIEWIQLK